MKKLLSLIVCLLFAVVASAQFSGSGTGTESDPYRIYNPDQLNQIRNFLEKTGVYFSLEADIDLEEWIEENNPTQGWMPIGSRNAYFRGVFEGNGHAISGLYINRSGMDYVGFFGYCSSAKISNVTFTNARVFGKDNTGVLCGYLSGNPSGNIKIMTSIVSGNQYVGGICGESGCNLENCCVKECKINGEKYVGGLIGKSGGYQISGSYAMADVNEDANFRESDYVGGLCGNQGCSIIDCHFYGTVYGRNYVGGISGNSSTIKKSSANASIFGTGDNVGGISGCLKSSIEDVYFTGSVYGNNNVGGIAGLSTSYSVSRAVSHARVILGNSRVGGITYYTKNSISANEEISGHDNVYRVGSSSSSSNNLAWVKTRLFEDGQQIIAEDGYKHGNSIGLSALKLKATYQGLGWDFTDTWAIQDTECFPYFKVQTAPPYFTSKVVSGTTTLSGKCIENGVVTITIGDKEYKTTSSGYNWSVNVSALKTGEDIQISAQATGKLPSYYVYATVSPSGSGTEADPYQVFSAEDLQAIKMNSSDHYKLMNDIDLTSWISNNNPSGGWNPVGSTSAVLMASFDGGGHTISGLWTNTTDDYIGLFSRSNGSTIKNLTVKIATGRQLKGGSYVGAISAYNNGNIENCKVVGDVTATGIAGGVAGFSSGTITTTTYSGNVTSTGAGSIGGIAGENTGNITRCCTVDGLVSASGNGAKAGGVCGKSSGTIENCYSVVPVTSSAEDSGVSAAGLVGYNEGTVSKCYASGNVESGYKGSGVVGYNYGSQAAVSNLIGLNQKVSAKNSAFRVVGGFANGAASPGTDNKAIKSMVLSVNGVAQKIYDDPLNGYAIDDAKALQRSTYTGMGWDMSATWNIDENSGFPYLRTSSAPVVTKTYTLTYKVDGVVCSTETHKAGDNITPIANPTKDGYTFSGWSNVPSVMPAYDVTVTGQFTKNSTPSTGNHGAVLETGKCGDNATYTVYEDATLVISGTGAMYDYSYQSEKQAPWYGSYRTFIKGIILEYGITEIGNYAFCGCSEMTYVTISNSVTSIGDEAFGCCGNLTMLTIPNSVTSIASSAFIDCSGLTSIIVAKDNGIYDSRDNCNAIIEKSTNTLIRGCKNTVIPNSVTSIGESAFRECSDLKTINIPNSVTSIDRTAFIYSGLVSIVIPKSVTNIGDSAFGRCKDLASIVVAKDNEKYDSRDNCNAIIEKSTNILIVGCKNTVIPNSVTNIDYEAFHSCTTLTSITIPNSVTSIGGYAFYNCSRLTSIAIPNSVTTIGGYAFYLCYMTDVYNYSTTPQQLSGNSFSEYGTLHVLRGCKTAYENAECWNKFTIVEDLGPDEVYVESISLNKTSLELTTGDMSTLTASVMPSNADDKNVVWSSSNTSVATVDNNGVVTAIAAGTATIIATAADGNGANASCQVAVTAPAPENPSGEVNATDISKYANIIYFNPTTARPGTKLTIPLMMNNEAGITALQFNVELPDGVNIDTNSKGKYALRFNPDAERTDASCHTLSSKQQDDGSVLVLCYSVENELFAGNSGAVIDFPITLSDDIAADAYPVRIKNVVMTKSNKEEVKIDEVVCLLDVPDYKMGDVNSDDIINVTDIVYTADHILGNKDANFNVKAADMNEDDIINVTDIVYIADMILSGTANGAKAQSAKSMSRASGESTLGIMPFNITSGAKKTVTLDMTNPGREITAFQFDMYLPDGLTIDKKKNGKFNLTFNIDTERTDASCHTLAASLQDSGAITFLCYSVDKDAFADEQGAVVDIPLTASTAMPDGEYEIRLENILLTCTDKSEIKPANVTVKVTVGNTTSISDLSEQNGAETLYNVNGMRQSTMRNGINIVRMGDGTVKKVAK